MPEIEKLVPWTKCRKVLLEIVEYHSPYEVSSAGLCIQTQHHLKGDWDVEMDLTSIMDEVRYLEAHGKLELWLDADGAGWVSDIDYGQSRLPDDHEWLDPHVKVPMTKRPMTGRGAAPPRPDGSVLASGGWVAPSEVLYDLVGDGEHEELTLPEVSVTRGGIRYDRPGVDMRGA